MWYAAALAVLLLGGIAVGLALAKGKYLSIALLPLIALGAIVLIPRTRETACRFAERLLDGDAHPPELLGAWVGWDTRFATPYCRLELRADGTGRCAMWYRGGRTEVWNVTRWNVARDRIGISLMSGERSEEMRGEVAKGSLLLEYFGHDDFDHVRNWLGPLHLVPETAEAEARQAVGRALETR